MEREKFFKKPAFKALEFQSRVNGVGSITYELNSLLVGRLDYYIFAINPIDPESEKNIIEFIPLIETEGHEDLVEELINNHGFSQNRYLSVIAPFSEEELNDRQAIENVILGLDNTLKKLNAIPQPITDEKIGA